MFGTDHWGFEWTMVAKQSDKSGEAFTAKVDMVDVVNIDTAAGDAEGYVWTVRKRPRWMHGRGGVSLLLFKPSYMTRENKAVYLKLRFRDQSR